MAAKKNQALTFLSHEDLLAAADAIAELARLRGERVALVGAVALQVWGSPRLTRGVDVVATSTLGRKGEAIPFGGVRTTIAKVPVSVIARSDERQKLYDEALREAVRVEAVPMRVVRPEELLAMKMVARRPTDDEDARFLMLLASLNDERAERVIRKHLGPYAVDVFRRRAEEARWRERREG